ncbi:MFS transporter [Parasporobacterium paucivorans]|uniref:Drug resistance transporter, EmrB/QacA subfamily n=1 Tax=Parasporobacterium paucivorans DSM 15970 TaxID=1122934 RepID=A0A1M6GYN2_9FIRM|nr:MFS transporter [Parasporobacterium paucivorans]SHJ15069.1 drug resistance transporter, EmrB/QacA subfamily [Parasporobacterium paucivorans DSM 15970]
MDTKHNKLILFTTSLGAFIVPFINSAINIALPSISRDFSLGSILLNWIPLSFTLAVAIFILPFGRLADILGRKKLLVLGMLLFAISSILSGLSTGPGMLIFFRIFQGISGSAISVTLISILTSVFPAGSRGKALGLNVAMTYIGLSVGPYLGGLLVQYFSWRSIFFFSAVIAFIIFISLIGLKQEWAEAKGEKFDLVGSTIYGIALMGIISGFSFIQSIWGIILILVGLAATAFFIVYENRTKYPILNISLFRYNKVLAFSSLAALINYSATFALSYLLSIYLQNNFGFDSAKAGLVLIAQPVVMAVFSPVTGFLSDRIEPQKVATLGMSITTLGLCFFIFLNKNTSIAYIVVALLILGFGFALFSSPNTNAIMSSVEKKYYGVTSGILGAARTVGQAFSMGISSLVLALIIGNQQISPQNAPELLSAVKTTFTILVILSFFGIFASLARGKMHTDTAEKK